MTSIKSRQIHTYLEYDLIHKDRYISFENYFKFINSKSKSIEKYYALSENQLYETMINQEKMQNTYNGPFDNYEYYDPPNSYDLDIDEDCPIDEYEQYIACTVDTDVDNLQYESDDN